jgi:glyoxylase-like metal-dependent hydrolase (beta-lactamase superfamily II)
LVCYVGTGDPGSFLITTSAGNVLINSDDTAPQIRASVEKPGFKFSDIKILLGSQAHGDHMGRLCARERNDRRAGEGNGAGRPGDFAYDARK